MAASPNDFVHDVARARGLRVTGDGHVFRLEPRDASPAWHCDLDDGTPTGDDDPASFVRWVCPALRDAPPFQVGRTGPHSDLGRIVSWLGRLAGRPAAEAGGYAYTDPSGILDDALRHRIEHWPAAPHGDGVVRPAELWSIQVKREGLIVNSVSWWGSAAALEHQLALADEIAARLLAVPPPPPA